MKDVKAVIAVIRPNKLPALRDALMALPGFPGMTVMKVEGCSGPKRQVAKHSIKDELTEYTAKVRVEIIAPEDAAEAIFQKVVEVSQTGHFGDGLVWMLDVGKAAFVFKTAQDFEG